MNLDDILIDLSPTHLSLLLPCSCRYTGTAVYGEGIGTTWRIINLKVDENHSGEKIDFDSPENSIRSYAHRQGWTEPAVGFMTSASMDSYASSRLSYESLEIETHLTAGLSNARCAGDKAEFREVFTPGKIGGTINTIIICNIPLTLTAALETLMISAGAKAGVLGEMNVKSRVSNAVATGTGTDSTIIIYPESSSPQKTIEFAGMHTVSGELIGRTVSNALKKSLSWYQNAEL